ncbi:Lrp/AsnC family transcriptional regulator [Halobaculum sp. MBLA0147]|uniref:Lrp/AsnC family transcriptional regulator n=1 Tax=Halobaculum sp. MBLA0147 TaxID=3079934 RepID=UPI003525DEF7
MRDGELDSVDEQILYHLQRDARRTSSREIGEALGLSPSTIRTRLNELEDSGIVRGYHVDVDYERAGYPLYTKIVCTATVPDRDDLASRARRIEGVTAVREVMTGERNVYVNAIGESHDDLNRIATELDELGLTVVDEQLVREEYVCPYHGFRGEETRGGDEDGSGDDESPGRDGDDGDTTG